MEKLLPTAVSTDIIRASRSAIFLKLRLEPITPPDMSAAAEPLLATTLAPAESPFSVNRAACASEVQTRSPRGQGIGGQALVQIFLHGGNLSFFGIGHEKTSDGELRAKAEGILHRFRYGSIRLLDHVFLPTRLKLPLSRRSTCGHLLRLAT
jgi:hypothetical protein